MEMSKHERMAKAHGIYMILEVVTALENAGIVCCITSVKALRYYGAYRVSSVGSCTPIFDYADYTSDTGSGLARLRAR